MRDNSSLSEGSLPDAQYRRLGAVEGERLGLVVFADAEQNTAAAIAFAERARKNARR